MSRSPTSPARCRLDADAAAVGPAFAEADRVCAGSVSAVVDLDAAIGFVVAHGDAVDRARLVLAAHRHAPRPPSCSTTAEVGQTADGGWPATWGGDVASIDATCFRLAELDDLGALGRPAARRALDWLAARQRPDGSWEEDAVAGRRRPRRGPGPATRRPGST